MTQDEFRKGCVEPMAALSASMSDIKRLLEGEPRYKIKGILTRLEEIETLLEPVEKVFADKQVFAELQWVLSFRQRFEAFRAGLILTGILSAITAIVTIASVLLRVLGVTE